MGEQKWYVLRTAGGKEKKAKEYLEKEIERSGLQDQVSQVLVPVKKEIVNKNGKRKAVDKLLFPGYVLIEAELSAKLENIIRNLVPGMSGFLTEKKTTTGAQFERIPVPLREEEVRRILGTQDDEKANMLPEEEADPDYDGYFSTDDYTHLEVFTTATPEPDSAAAEYDFR